VSITGVAIGEIDPDDPLNAVIQDIRRGALRENWSSNSC
jgi:hypothetical protein